MLGELGYSLAHHYFTSSDVKVRCNKCATITKTTVAIIKKKAFKCWGCVELSMLDSIRHLLPDSTLVSYHFTTIHDSDLTIRCPHGHVYDTKSVNVVRNKSRCPICFGSGKKKVGTAVKWTQDGVVKYANSHGYQVASEFITAKEKVMLICPEGHNYEVKWAAFSGEQQHRCRACLHARQRNDISVITAALGVYGYLADDLSSYEDQMTVFWITCNRGHRYRGSWARFKSGSRCPECRSERDGAYWASLEERSKDRVNRLMPGYKFIAINRLGGYLRRVRIQCPAFHEINLSFGAIGKYLCSSCNSVRYNLSLPTLDVLSRYYAAGYSVQKVCEEKPYVIMRCNNQHDYRADWGSFTSGGRCPHCDATGPEKQISDFLNQHQIPFVLHDRKQIGPKELDFFLPKHKAAIEFCGSYWHSDLDSQSYHQDKMLACQNRDITLLTIWEHEWQHGRDEILNKIMMLAGLLKTREAEPVIVEKPGSLTVEQNGTVVLAAKCLEKLCFPTLVHGEAPRLAIKALVDAGYTLVIDATCNIASWLGPPCQIFAPELIESDWLASSGRRTYDCGKLVYNAPGLVAHQAVSKLLGADVDTGSYENLSEYVFAKEMYSPELRRFIHKYEWMKTVGNVPKWCFTARARGTLVGVVMLNTPNSCSSELPRTLQCLIQRGASSPSAHKHTGSKLVSYAIRWMTANTSKRLFVGYADVRAGEVGVIYQACNFLYLGASFGAKEVLRHPKVKNGKEFTKQYLGRTSVLRRFCQDNQIEMQKSWFLPSGFKNLKTIPPDVISKWRAWGKQTVVEAEKVSIPGKGKYAMVTGKTAKEKKNLLATFLAANRRCAYPKRSTSRLS